MLLYFEPVLPIIHLFFLLSFDNLIYRERDDDRRRRQPEPLRCFAPKNANTAPTLQWGQRNNEQLCKRMRDGRGGERDLA